MTQARDTRAHDGHYASHRFFVTQDAIEGAQVRFSSPQRHQICRVLRLARGDRVVVCDGSGLEYIVAIGGEASSTGTIVERREGRAEPRCRVRLYQSGLRGDHFSWLLQKGTEVGVAAFTPVIFGRTQHADYSSRLDRYRAIVQEAAEQCERSSLPRVEEPLAFSSALARVLSAGQGLGVLLDEREGLSSLQSKLLGWRQIDAPARIVDVSVFVGPEGGLTETERALAIEAGTTPVSLGRRVLRSETAGLVASVLILAATGDLG